MGMTSQARHFQDAIILFGDSLTQECTEGSLAYRLTYAYQRKMDVLNRGFGDYNSEWAIPLFKRIFPMRFGRSEFPQIKLVTIWFGTNDAVLPDASPSQPSDDSISTTGQSVPLETYIANLNKMIDSFLEPFSEFRLPGVRIALVTPPPVVLTMRQSKQAKVELDHTRKYKDACLAVGKEWSRKYGGRVQPVDCWKALTDAAGGENDDALRPFFADGVHLTPKGYELVYDELMRIIRKEWKHLDPANIKPTVPRYNAESDSWEWSYEPKPVLEREK